MARYKVIQDVRVSGNVVFPIGTMLEGDLITVPSAKGERQVLPAVKGELKVLVPSELLKVEEGNPVKKSENRATPVWPFVIPAAGLTAGLVLAKFTGGGIRNYIGYGLIGLALGGIPTFIHFRKKMLEGSLKVAESQAKSQRSVTNDTQAIVKSVNSLYLAQTNNDLDAKTKAGLIGIVEASKMNTKESAMLRKYMTLAANLSLYGGNTSLPEADQKRIESQRKEADDLLVQIYRNEKLSALVKQLTGE